MVLSISNVSPTQGCRYYTAEGYYSTEEQQSRSGWVGKLAAELGLTGQVNPAEFHHLLHGRSPNGEQLVNKSRLYGQQRAMEINGSDRKRIPTALAGYDLTTSAPKSLSIQAIVFGDDRLELAHQTATARMLEIAEERYATTRITQQRKRQVVNTKNLLVGQFHHDTSRALDPQLHTHNLVLNLVKLESGKWQAIDNCSLYAHKMLLGRIYRNELAREVQVLSYEIEVTNQRHGLWELKGYTPEQLDHFSKRARQIQTTTSPEATAQEKAWVAAHSNRAKKQAIDRVDLLPRWQAEAQAAAIIPVVPYWSPSPSSADVKAIVRDAIAHCSQREAGFRREEIEWFALSNIGQVSIADLQAAIAQIESCNQENPLELQGVRTDASIQRNSTGTADRESPIANHSGATPERDRFPSQTEGGSTASDAGRPTCGIESNSDGTQIPGLLAPATRVAGLDAAHPSDCRAGRPASRHLEAATPESNYTQADAGSSSEEDRSHRHCLHQLADEFAELERVFSGESIVGHQPPNTLAAPDRDQPEAADDDGRANQEPDSRRTQHIIEIRPDLEDDWEPNR